MAGGTFYGSTNNQYITPKIVWSSAPNVEGNYSTVTATLYVSRNNSGYTTSGTWSGGINIDGGQTTVSKSVSIGYNSNTLLISHTVNVPHNDDGTKTITISGWGGISGTSYTSTSISAQLTIDTIPRASSFSIPSTDIVIGSSVPITITRANPYFSHVVYINFNGMTTLATGVGTSFTWNTGNQESVFYGSLQNSIYDYGTIVVETYTSATGGTFVGTKTLRCRFIVPDNVRPIFNTITIDHASTDLETKFGGYVQYKSKGRIRTTASGNKGSTIKNINVNIDGKNYTGADVTTENINLSGTVNIIVTITDSRGRTSYTGRSITVIPYYNPLVTSLNIQRCNEKGVITDEGANVKVVTKGQVASIDGKNTYGCKLFYKEKSATTWLVENVTMNSHTLVGDFQFGNNNFNTSKSYDFRLELSDYFSTTPSITSIGTASPPIDFKGGGKGVAIGKVAEYDNLFDVNLPTKLRSSLDVIGVLTANGVSLIESGVNANGRYLKFANGIAICYKGIFYGDLDFSTLATNNIYYSTNFLTKDYINFPITFYEYPETFINIASTGYMSCMVTNNYLEKFRARLWSYYPGVQNSVTLSYMTIGRWKA